MVERPFPAPLTLGVLTRLALANTMWVRASGTVQSSHSLAFGNHGSTEMEPPSVQMTEQNPVGDLWWTWKVRKKPCFKSLRFCFMLPQQQTLANPDWFHITDIEARILRAHILWIHQIIAFTLFLFTMLLICKMGNYLLVSMHLLHQAA